VHHGLIVAGSDYYDKAMLAHVASKDTLTRRLDRTVPPDYLIIDEAHHALASNSFGKIIASFLERNPRMRIIGVTATPERLDGSGLGETFDDMVLGPTTRELIELGRLSKYEIHRPKLPIDMQGVRRDAKDFKRDDAAGFMDKPSITGDAIAQYRSICPGTKFIARGVSIVHSNHIAESFRAQGIACVHVDGDTPDLERRRIIKDFRAGELQGLTNVDLFSEGLDIPNVETFIDCRPTESLALYLQGQGRALRVFPGKTVAHLLDPAGNYWRFGLPDEERDWSLDGESRAKRARDPDDVGVKTCRACGTTCRALAQKCDGCGKEFTVKPRIVEQREGELEKVDLEAARAEAEVKRQMARAAQAQAQSVDDMVAMGYSRGRAEKIVEARAEKEQLRADLKSAVIEYARMTDTAARLGGIRDMKPKELRAALAEVRAQIQGMGDEVAEDQRIDSAA
jgi:DNA repair protein RadD